MFELTIKTSDPRALAKIAEVFSGDAIGKAPELRMPFGQAGRALRTSADGDLICNEADAFSEAEQTPPPAGDAPPHLGGFLDTLAARNAESQTPPPAGEQAPPPPAGEQAPPPPAGEQAPVEIDPAQIDPSCGLDKAGCPWYAPVHSGGKTKVTKGTWKFKSGGDREAKEALIPHLIAYATQNPQLFGARESLFAASDAATSDAQAYEPIEFATLVSKIVPRALDPNFTQKLEATLGRNGILNGVEGLADVAPQLIAKINHELFENE